MLGRSALLAATNSDSSKGSLYVSSSGGGAVGNDNSLSAFGTGDFTLEAWIYLRNRFGANLIDLRAVNGSRVPSLLINQVVTGRPDYYTNSPPTGIFTGPNLVPLTTWTHVSLCRSSGTTRLFMNGIVQFTMADNRNHDNTQTDNNPYGFRPFRLGFNSTFDVGLYGLNDVNYKNIRIAKAAFYSDNFTPPTELQTGGPETLLLIRNGLRDESVHNQSLTFNNVTPSVLDI